MMYLRAGLLSEKLLVSSVNALGGVGEDRFGRMATTSSRVRTWGRCHRGLRMPVPWPTGHEAAEDKNRERVMATTRICKVALVAGFAVATGCASIQTTSQSLPDVAPPSFARVLVAAPLGDLDLRTSVEAAVASEGTGVGIELIPYHEVFLVGREYPVEDMLSELDARGIEGMLLISDATQDPPTITSRARAVPMVTGEVVVTGAQGTRQDRFTIVTRPSISELRSRFGSGARESGVEVQRTAC